MPTIEKKKKQSKVAKLIMKNSSGDIIDEDDIVKVTQEYIIARDRAEQATAALEAAKDQWIAHVKKKKEVYGSIKLPTLEKQVSLTTREDLELDLERVIPFLERRNLLSKCQKRVIKKGKPDIATLREYLPRDVFEETTEVVFDEDLFFRLVNAGDEIRLEEVQAFIKPNTTYSITVRNHKEKSQP